MTMYVVVRIDYHDFHLGGVFDNQDEAEAAIRKFRQRQRPYEANRWFIELVELNKGIPYAD